MMTVRVTDGWGPASAADVVEIERLLRWKLPEDYRAFLLTTNGGRPERDRVRVPGCKESPVARIHFFFGAGSAAPDCYDLAWPLKEWEDLPENALVIASTEGADTFYLKPTGEVVFWDGYDKSTYPVAKTFSEFIDRLLGDELSPGSTHREDFAAK